MRHPHWLIAPSINAMVTSFFILIPFFVIRITPTKQWLRDSFTAISIPVPEKNRARFSSFWQS
jgi:hypothetical protein